VSKITGHSHEEQGRMPWKSALATFGRRMGKLKRERLTMDKPEIWKAERRTGRELEQLAFGRGFRYG